MKMYGCISLGHCMGVNGVACTSGGHSCYCVRLENAVTTCNVLGKLKWWTSSLQRQAQRIPSPTCCTVQSTWNCKQWPCTLLYKMGHSILWHMPATWWRVSVGVGMSVARLLWCILCQHGRVDSPVPNPIAIPYTHRVIPLSYSIFCLVQTLLLAPRPIHTTPTHYQSYHTPSEPKGCIDPFLV